MFAVVDAGGSTVDSTLYECKETTPKLVLEEVCASECVQAGSVFVDRAAQLMLEAKLQGSKFSDDVCIRGILGEFERKTKRKFDGTQASSIIKFGMVSRNVHLCSHGQILTFKFRTGITTVNTVFGRAVSLLPRTTWKRRSLTSYRGSNPAA